MRGHITKKHGSYFVVLDLGTGGARKQRWIRAGSTKAEAERLRIELLHGIQNGVDLPIERLTVNDYLDRWLANVKRSLAPKTHHRYAELLDRHVRPVIGALLLEKVRPLQIQAIYTRMLDAGSAPRTVIQCGRIVHKALSDAVKFQLVRINPANATTLPHAERFSIPEMPIDEINRLLDVADEHGVYGGMVRLAVLTGMRLGEVSGLRWQDVDFASGTVAVRQTCQYVPGQGHIFKEPKTQHSHRAISVTEKGVAFLRRRKAQQAAARLVAGSAYRSDLDLVFTNAIGEPVSSNTTRDAWKRITAQAGVPTWRFHDLRHAHATLMLRAGVSLKVVSARLGHSSIAITADTYSHVTADLQLDAAQRLERVMQGE
jgi:integrase